MYPARGDARHVRPLQHLLLQAGQPLVCQGGKAVCRPLRAHTHNQELVIRIKKTTQMITNADGRNVGLNEPRRIKVMPPNPVGLDRPDELRVLLPRRREVVPYQIISHTQRTGTGFSPPLPVPAFHGTIVVHPGRCAFNLSIVTRGRNGKAAWTVIPKDDGFAIFRPRSFAVKYLYTFAVDKQKQWR